MKDLSVEIEANCSQSTYTVCDTTPYYPASSVVRNMIIYDCDGNIRSEHDGNTEYCINLSGRFEPLDVVYITINGVQVGYQVQLSDIVLPDTYINQDQAYQLTYQNILNGLWKAVQQNDAYCGENYEGEISQCDPTCQLRLTSKLPGCPFAVAIYVDFEPSSAIDLCEGASNIEVIANANGDYTIYQGYVYVYNGDYYVGICNGSNTNYTLVPPNTDPCLEAIVCPYIQVVPRPFPPDALAIPVHVASPNMGARPCVKVQLPEDGIYLAQFCVTETVPDIYRQDIEVLNGGTTIGDIVDITPPVVLGADLPLANIMVYAQATTVATAHCVAEQFNKMLELSGIDTTYVWAEVNDNIVSIYTLAQTYSPADVTFIVTGYGTVVLNVSDPVLEEEHINYYSQQVSFAATCILNSIIIKLIAQASTSCPDNSGTQALELKSRLDSINYYLCQNNVTAACKVFKETKALKVYKGNCGPCKRCNIWWSY